MNPERSLLKKSEKRKVNERFRFTYVKSRSRIFFFFYNASFPSLLKQITGRREGHVKKTKESKTITLSFSRSFILFVLSYSFFLLLIQPLNLFAPLIFIHMFMYFTHVCQCQIIDIEANSFSCITLYEDGSEWNGNFRLRLCVKLMEFYIH